MNINHVEYKLGRFVTEFAKSLNINCNLLKFGNGFCRSCMEYFNLRIAKYG